MNPNPRSRARIVAMQLLFQSDLNPGVSPEDVSRFARRQLSELDLITFAISLYDGTMNHLTEINKHLSRAAENWSVNRMAVIDRNILRLGSYELLFCEETPASVIIDEAIELARGFGSPDSPGFVNGVLDRVLRDKPAQPAVDSEVGATAPEATDGATLES
jgi:N utilization substance protein B